MSITANELPLCVEDLSAEWLNHALAEQLTNAQPITGFQPTIIGVGEGFMGQLARVTLDYADSEQTAGPASIIAKFAAPTQAARDIANDQGLYQREVGFYEDIGEDAGVPIPACYFSTYLPESNRVVLLLQDLSPAIASDQVIGTARQDSEKVIDMIAQLHARWWNSERLAGYGWAQPIVSSIPMEQGLAMIKEAIHAAETQGTFDAYPEIKRLMKYLPPLFRMDPPPPFPYTLCHGDLRSDNVFCPTEAGGNYALIDWQLSGMAQPANDLARWFTQSITIEDRRETEMDLLKRYHDKITEYGVTGYSFKQLLNDYKLNLVVLLLMFSNTMEDIDKSDERSKAVLHSMYERLDVALADWKIINLLKVLPYMIPFLKLSSWFKSTFNR
ncbi:MAG: oxidoreductase family protein [Pseudomonadota bacterium]